MKGEHFRLHRQRLVDTLIQHHLKRSIVFMRSPPNPLEPFSKGDLQFYQEALFFWLTGWTRPDSILVIDVFANKSILFIPDYDDDYEIWSGPIPLDSEVINETGVDEVLPISLLETTLATIYSMNHPNYRLLGYHENPSQKIDNVGTLQTAAAISRRIKFDHEIDALRRSARITSDALISAMRYCHSGIPEKNVSAHFIYNATLLGGESLAFPTIVASGLHCAYLHYSENKDICHDGDLALVDCGVFVDHYAGDVSRTFPVNGKFSPVQRKVYTLLYRLQMSLINQTGPGVDLLNLNKHMEEGIFNILKELAIVPQEMNFNSQIAQLFCPHAISHHIGCNCHDLSFWNENSKIRDDQINTFILQPNMVISVEPGIYFHKVVLEGKRSKPQFSKINFDRACELAEQVCGIRIEDDVRVTPDGREVLSNCPKDPDEIEAIMAQCQQSQ